MYTKAQLLNYYGLMGLVKSVTKIMTEFLRMSKVAIFEALD